jgi:hypothetical protein
MLLTITTRLGSLAVAPLTSNGTISLTRLNTPRTFKSKTFWLAQSGLASNGPPHVAPAFAIWMSILSSVSQIWEMRVSIEEVRETSADIPIARPQIPGRALRLETAWSRPSCLRAVMITFFAPASRNAVAVCRPRPRDPVISQFLWSVIVNCMFTSCDQCDFAIQAEEFGHWTDFRHLPEYTICLQSFIKNL